VVLRENLGMGFKDIKKEGITEGMGKSKGCFCRKSLVWGLKI